jgi:hypothetical protein
MSLINPNQVKVFFIFLVLCIIKRVFYIGPLSFATVLVATLSFYSYSVLPDSRSRCSQIRLDAVSVYFHVSYRSGPLRKNPHSTRQEPRPRRRPGTAPPPRNRAATRSPGTAPPPRNRAAAQEPRPPREAHFPGAGVLCSAGARLRARFSLFPSSDLSSLPLHARLPCSNLQRRRSAPLLGRSSPPCSVLSLSQLRPLFSAPARVSSARLRARAPAAASLVCASARVASSWKEKPVQPSVLLA